MPNDAPRERDVDKARIERENAIDIHFYVREFRLAVGIIRAAPARFDVRLNFHVVTPYQRVCCACFHGPELTKPCHQDPCPYPDRP